MLNYRRRPKLPTVRGIYANADGVWRGPFKTIGGAMKYRNLGFEFPDTVVRDGRVICVRIEAADGSWIDSPDLERVRKLLDRLIDRGVDYEVSFHDLGV